MGRSAGRSRWPPLPGGWSRPQRVPPGHGAAAPLSAAAAACLLPCRTLLPAPVSAQPAALLDWIQNWILWFFPSLFVAHHLQIVNYFDSFLFSCSRTPVPYLCVQCALYKQQDLVKIKDALKNVPPFLIVKFSNICWGDWYLKPHKSTSQRSKSVSQRFYSGSESMANFPPTPRKRRCHSLLLLGEPTSVVQSNCLQKKVERKSSFSCLLLHAFLYFLI